MAMTYPTMKTMGPERKFVGGGSLSSQYRRFKSRLKVVLQNTADTQEEIANLLEERHAKASQSTISRWMNPDIEDAPDMKQLIALMMSHKDMSVDWLLGRREAESFAEKFIESRI